MDKDFMTAEEMYNQINQAKHNEIAAFSTRWNVAKLIIRDNLVFAARKGKYETDVISIRPCGETDYCFIDFVVDKLEKAGYEVTTRESGVFIRIHVSCERGKSNGKNLDR